MKSLKYIVFLLFLLNISQVEAQRLKYKTVFEVVEQGNDQVSYPLLLEYQKQDPEMPNTYFQLGMIAEKWAKEYDPFTELKVVNYFVQSTRLYWGLAKSKIDDKEVKKNRKFYENAGIKPVEKKLQFEDVKVFVDKKFKDISDYQENMNKILNYYTKSADFYNNCVNTFRQINSRFPKLKDLYLNADDSVRNEILSLKTSFDSTLFYFEEFKVALKNYPIKNYNQNFVLKDIKTYRLEGLTSSDFLQNKVPLWNYGKWVSEVNKNIKKDIDKLTNQTIDANNELDKKISFYTKNPDDFSNKYKAYEIPKKLANLFNKYDFDPLVLHYFKQRISYNKLLAETRNQMCNPESIDKIKMQRRLNYYRSLVHEKEQTDSLLKYFQSKIDEKGIYKYRHIFIDKFGSKEIVEQYCQKQLEKNNQALDAAFDNLFKIIEKPVFTDTLELTYRNTKIKGYFSFADFEKAELNQYYITEAERNYKNELFFAGYIKGNGKNATAFVAKSSNSRDVDWLKAYTFKTNSYNYVHKIDLFSGGAIFAITSGLPDSPQQNIVVLDDKGAEIGKVKVDNVADVKKMFYDDINDHLLIAQKSDTDTKIDVSLFYPTEKKLAWTDSISADANIYGILRADTDFALFLNYQKHNLSDAEEISAANPNTLIINLNTETGKVSSYHEISYKTAYLGIQAEKLDSENIALLAQSGNKLVFIVIDPIGKVNYSNIKE